MKKLEIVEIKDYNVKTLQDDQENKYSIILDIISKDLVTSIGSIIYLNPKLLDEKGTYVFGPLGGIYGKGIEGIDDDEILILETDGKKEYLQRYYG